MFGYVSHKQQTAKRLGVGLMLLRVDGDAFFINDSWSAMTGVSTDPCSGESWWKHVSSIHAEEVRNQFCEAIELSAPWSSDMAIEKPDQERIWVRVNLTVEGFEDNEVKWFMMSMADFTTIKIAEEYERKSSQLAEERRKQQETFIDLFSHELRNPFSAILQSADSIHDTISEWDGTKETLDVDDVLDAANTINMCMQHQVSRPLFL